MNHRRNSHYRKLTFEQLEKRTLLAALTWDPTISSDVWNNTDNYYTVRPGVPPIAPPGANDSVTFGVANPTANTVNANVRSVSGSIESLYVNRPGYTVSDYWPAGAGAEEAVIAAIQSGEAVTAGIFSDGNSEFNALNLVSQHAYMVASYNASNGTFQLVNPWGCYEPQALTWAELEEFCPEITVANTSSTAAANSQPSGMSRGEIHAAALE